MSDLKDFVIENGVLEKYTGEEGDVVIPEDVKSILMFTFYECTSLQTVTLPPNGVSIDSHAFQRCANLKELVVPSGSWLGGYSFSHCTSLESVIIMDGMTAIGPRVFENCSNLKHIRIPPSVKGINSKAFDGCNAIRSLECRTELIPVVFTDGAVTGYLVGDYSLDNNLMNYVNKKIKRNKKKFFKSIVSSNNDAAVTKFLNACQSISLEEVNEFLNLSTDVGSDMVSAVLLDYKNSHFNAAEIEEYEYTKDGKELGVIPMTLKDWKKIYTLEVDGKKVHIKRYKGTEENVIIPAEIEDMKVCSIMFKAFWKCTGLKNIVISEGINEINNQAFSDCTNLESVTVQGGMKKIDGYAFYRCKSLEQISLPDGVKLGYGVFEDCKALKTIVLPSGLSKIDGALFSGCSSLQSIAIPDGTERILDSAFYGCSKLRDITIPASVQRIHKESFVRCKKLTIHAPAGSYAEQYAKENNIPFVAE